MMRKRQGNVMRRFKKELIVAGILLSVLIFAGGAWGMNKEEYRETFSIKPGTVLKVYNRNGDIEVSSWDRDYVEVDAIKQRHWWNSLLKEPRIDVTSGNELFVRTLYSMALSEAIPVQYRITVPKGVLVTHLETSTGKIHVNEVSGDVDAKTSTGDIQIHRVDGFVKAVTSTGKIHITGVGGLFGAQTNTGKISVEVPEIRDNLEIRSSNGSITVFLSSDIAARLEVSTSNGQITYEDLPLTVNELSKTKLTGKLGEGSERIYIKTSTGSIDLKKLDYSSSIK
jgi:hypothetical protein